MLPPLLVSQPAAVARKWGYADICLERRYDPPTCHKAHRTEGQEINASLFSWLNNIRSRAGERSTECAREERAASS